MYKMRPLHVTTEYYEILDDKALPELCDLKTDKWLGRKQHSLRVKTLIYRLSSVQVYQLSSYWFVHEPFMYAVLQKTNKGDNVTRNITNQELYDKAIRFILRRII